MASFFNFFSWSGLLDYLRSLFFSRELEVALIGLQGVGKTSLVNILAKDGAFSEDLIPTVGFNLRQMHVGSVQLKVWDLGGQPRFRGMWRRYCSGVGVVVFVVDAADRSTLDTAKNELHSLLRSQTDSPLAAIPLLVLGNKIDLPGALTTPELIEALDLPSIAEEREVNTYSISCKHRLRIDDVLKCLLKCV